MKYKVLSSYQYNKNLSFILVEHMVNDISIKLYPFYKNKENLKYNYSEDNPMLLEVTVENNTLELYSFFNFNYFFSENNAKVSPDRQKTIDLFEKLLGDPYLFERFSEFMIFDLL
jgi:hypothetical protein